MPDVDINELDASDLSDILTEVKGERTKVKNVVSARKELTGLIAEKGLALATDDEGNFTLTAVKAKKAAPAPTKKAAAKPAPEPVEEEEEEEETKPAPKAKVKPAPVKSKGPPKAAPKDADEDEDEEEAPKAKRPPPPREARYKPEQRIKMLKKDASFKDGSNRSKKLAILMVSKTVGSYLEGCAGEDLGSAPGFLKVCVDAGIVSVS